jgi:fucose permease
LKSSRLFLLGCYAFIALGVSTGVIGPALPTLAAHANVSLDQAGYLFATMSIGYLISAPMISWAGPRVGTRVMLIVSPLIGIASMVIFALGQAMPVLMLGTVLLGIGQSGTQVAYNAMFGSSEGASKKLGQLNAFYGIGALLAPLVASFGYAQFAEATVAFVVAAALLAVLSVGAVLWRGNKSKGQRSRGAGERVSSAPSPLTSPAPLRSPTLWLMSIVMGLYVGCEVAFSGWTTEFTRRSTGIPLAQAAASTSVFWVGLALSRYFAPTLFRIQPARLVLLMFGVTVAGYVLMAAFGSALPVVLAGAFVVGAGMGPVYPTLIAIAIQRFPQYATLMASVLTSVGSLGALFLPTWVGVVLTTQSLTGAWLLQVGVLGIVAALWFVELRRTRPESAVA